MRFHNENKKAVTVSLTKPLGRFGGAIFNEDDKVIDYLKFLTFLSKEEIEELDSYSSPFDGQALSDERLGI